MTKNIVIAGLALVVLVGGYFSIARLNGTSAVAELIPFVDSAATLVASEGDQAFAQLSDMNGEWIKGDRYIFVYDMAGNTLVLPLQKDVEGTNRIAVTDPNGEAYVKTMVDILKTRAYGWNSYVYLRPETKETQQKLSYFKKVVFGSKEYIVGSGIYLEK
ncbi:MAG: cache domain-containing protein [Candidatus Paceibacterota bacterium]|jgi:signal transduction histidine kinase